MTRRHAVDMNDGATFTAQLTGGVRRLAALSHSVRDEDTVLRALRYELYYALDVDDVRFEPRADPTWPSLPLIVDNRRRGVLVFVTHPPRRLNEDEIDAGACLEPRFGAPSSPVCSRSVSSRRRFFRKTRERRCSARGKAVYTGWRSV